MCCTSVSRKINFNGIYNFKHLKDTYFAKNKFMYFWGLFFYRTFFRGFSKTKAVCYSFSKTKAVYLIIVLHFLTTVLQ